MKEIDTRLVYGFLDAGKTTYIKEAVRDDLFYRRGKTLILCFEEGEEEYDEELLRERNAAVSFYRGETAGSCGEDEITRFCSESIEKHQPDRVYVEMNTMMSGLRESLPDCMRVTFSAALIDWATLPVYYVNFMQMMKQFVSESNQITFRGCPSAELLAPYGQPFRLMNPRASYLRQDPMGYHEKAFGVILPFSIDESEIRVTEKTFLPLWLDALDHPEHYDGKVLIFTVPVELRRTGGGPPRLGRVVMTCCMADLQFMSFDVAGMCEHAQAEEEPDVGGASKPAPAPAETSEIMEEKNREPERSWVTGNALCRVITTEPGQRRLTLTVNEIRSEKPPLDYILDGRRGE